MTSAQSALHMQLPVPCAAVPGTADTWCLALICALVARQDGGPTVTSWDGPRDLLFDYYNFPPESYKYKYPSPGSPQLAQRIVSLFRWAHMLCQCANAAKACQCNV